MDDRTQQLVSECKRQEEASLYASTAALEWLKELRYWRTIFVIAPMVLVGVATCQIIADQPEWKWFAGVSALLAGIMPAVYKALDLDVNLGVLAGTARQFTLLQDRFRQAASVSALGPFDAFKCEFADLMTRMDAVRTVNLAPPQRFLKRARAKIAKGQHEFRVDQLPFSQLPPAAGSSGNLMQMTTPRKTPNSL